ncbi:MAG: hypothetical protein FJW29_12490 [Acidobacteria bacterium]|nr:hypothetical protein [Acidobacteriota bacterium]
MLLTFFEWCEATVLGETIRTSLWLFPAIECVHLLGLVMLGGSVLMVDLRLLGVGLREQPIAQVADAGHRLLTTGLIIMLATGIPLFLSEAIKCYYSPSFWVKILTLLPAIAFALTVRRRVTGADPATVNDRQRTLTAVASLGLWFTVAAAGRWIGFS